MNAEILWIGTGIVLGATLAAVAFARSAHTSANVYERDLYGMSGGVHRTYALFFTAFALLLAAALEIRWIPGYAVLALLVLLAIFYGASFVRGAVDESEL